MFRSIKTTLQSDCRDMVATPHTGGLLKVNRDRSSDKQVELLAPMAGWPSMIHLNQFSSQKWM
jgi:hypothetical protein